MRFKLLITIIITFLILSCKGSPNSYEDAIIDNNVGKLHMDMSLVDAPGEVVFIKGDLTDVKHIPISFDFEIKNDSASAFVENIPHGTWNLTVNAFDDNYVELYTGSTIIEILPNQTTSANVYLKPTTGNLHIWVTWDTPGNILFYDSESTIYLASDKTNHVLPVLTGLYPFWMDSNSKIAFNSPSNNNFYIADAYSLEIIKTYNISGHGTFIFGRYSVKNNRFLFTTNPNGLYSIAMMDLEGKITVMNRYYPIANPVCSQSDDWIYYLNGMDETWDIYRMKLDGSLDERIVGSEEFEYENFSVSYDGDYIVAPKNSSSQNYIAIINTLTKAERLIELSYMGFVGFTSFSVDNEYIYFVGTTNRDVYRINFDGSNLILVTEGEKHFARPLTW